jgi:mRNA-degrading endonuclease RelE of RelBE toxin-antitoxin system
MGCVVLASLCFVGYYCGCWPGTTLESSASSAYRRAHGWGRSLAASPQRVGKPLKLGLEGLHSARRGDYRVIYRIDDHRRRVDVVAIEHRSDIYRPRQP